MALEHGRMLLAADANQYVSLVQSNLKQCRANRNGSTIYGKAMNATNVALQRKVANDEAVFISKTSAFQHKTLFTSDRMLIVPLNTDWRACIPHELRENQTRSKSVTIIHQAMLATKATMWTGMGIIVRRWPKVSGTMLLIGAAYFLQITGTKPGQIIRMGAMAIFTVVADVLEVADWNEPMFDGASVVWQICGMIGIWFMVNKILSKANTSECAAESKMVGMVNPESEDTNTPETVNPKEKQMPTASADGRSKGTVEGATADATTLKAGRANGKLPRVTRDLLPKICWESDEPTSSESVHVDWAPLRSLVSDKRQSGDDATRNEVKRWEKSDPEARNPTREGMVFRTHPRCDVLSFGQGVNLVDTADQPGPSDRVHYPLELFEEILKVEKKDVNKVEEENVEENKVEMPKVTGSHHVDGHDEVKRIESKEGRQEEENVGVSPKGNQEKGEQSDLRPGQTQKDPVEEIAQEEESDKEKNNQTPTDELKLTTEKKKSTQKKKRRRRNVKHR